MKRPSGPWLRCSLSIAAALVCLAGVPSPAVAQDAWWLTEKFTPTQTSYEGLSATDIHPQWEKFSVLSYATLPPVAQSDVGWMKKEGFGFEKEGDFNRNGRRDRAVAGVYRDKAGRSGRFLLVVEQQQGKWVKTFLHTEPGEPGFSIITGPPGRVHWGPCLECDVGSILRPRGKTYALSR